MEQVNQGSQSSVTESGVPQLLPFAKQTVHSSGSPFVKKTVDSKAATFFVDLLCCLDNNFFQAATVVALLNRQADLGYVKASVSQLRDDLGGQFSRNSVYSALQALERRGVVQSDGRASSITRYRVNVPALQALLALPLPAAPVLPGITPLAAVDRLTAGLLQP